MDCDQGVEMSEKTGCFADSGLNIVVSKGF